VFKVLTSFKEANDKVTGELKIIKFAIIELIRLTLTGNTGTYFLITYFLFFSNETDFSVHNFWITELSAKLHDHALHLCSKGKSSTDRH